MLMKKFTSPSQTKGEIGEMIVCRYLAAMGFVITERNFTRKCGELDIIAQKDGKTHFIEVKSVSCENIDLRPEDQMHIWKTRRLLRTIEVYLSIHADRDWQFDLACVFMNFQTRRARVKMLWDVILA